MSNRRRITFFFRPKNSSAFSIEEIFNTLMGEFSDYYLISSFYSRNGISKLFSFLQSRFKQGDVNHLTGGYNPISFFLNPKKTIITIHDIGYYERNLKGIKKFIFGLIHYYLPLRYVSKITTVSEFTKQKIIDKFGINSNKITVIPNPVGKVFTFEQKHFNKNSPLILQIGGSSVKNLDRLIEAIRDTEFRLLLIRKPEKKIVNKLDLYKIQYEFRYNLTQEEVYECYKICDILYFASEHEGFGVPIIEAQSVGRVVLTSNFAPMTDVAGSGALFVNPFQIEEIKNALLTIKDNDDVRKMLVYNGQKNVDRFSVKFISKLYMALYEEVLTNNNAYEFLEIDD